MRIAIALIAVLSAATPSPAYAQWRLEPFAGVNFAAEHGFVDLDETGKRVHALFGGAAAWEWSDAWSVEVEFATAPRFLKGTSGLVETGRLDTFFGNVERRFGAGTSRVRPFLAAGVGAARVTLKDALDAFSSTTTLGAMTVGGGAIANMSVRTQLVGEVRYVRSTYGDAGRAGLGEQFVAFWRTTAGLRIRLP
ncbi:MAG TPA: outer membrane beta-barrel protein [Vicinamibacterales bacterium]|nr:outer membrane beta-barrel protein [Vicinamibacterales bacterium]